MLFHPALPAYPAVPAHSVINGSKVQSANTRNTVSNDVSKPIHSVATASSGGDCNSAAVPRTPAIMTGIVTGNNRIGSSTSRVLVLTSIAANSVPTDANPIVPSTSNTVN